MKRAVTLVLLAATTALTIPAAAAQDPDGAFSAGRAERQAARQAERAARQEVRQQERVRNDTPRQERVRDDTPRQERVRVEPPRVEAPAPVDVAQRRDRGERGDRTGGTSQTVRDAWQGTQNDPARARYERQAAENALRYGNREQRQEVRQDVRSGRVDLDRDTRRDVRQDRREDRRDWRGDRRDDRRDWRNDRRDWRRDWRNDRRYDWNGYRNQNRFIFRLNPYYSPYGYGYGYRRFGIGSILDSLLFGRNYWVSDPWQYRLPPAPPGYQWVRYYNDVVLVDTYTGRIEDVIYDFFW